MAISWPHYRCLKRLWEAGELPLGGSILEIGEANWYGDIPPEVLTEDFGWVDDGRRREKLEARFKIIKTFIPEERPFELAKLVYLTFLGTDKTTAIDANGTRDSLRLDLNQPIDLNKQFATVINHGTAEHVFNVANVFKVMHDHCRDGGLMIHESPFTGWVDHGFWTIQPTAYYDLAAANGYSVRFVSLNSIDPQEQREIVSREYLLELAAADNLPGNAMLFVAMRKHTNGPFRVPIQGYYSRSLSKEAELAWGALR